MGEPQKIVSTMAEERAIVYGSTNCCEVSHLRWEYQPGGAALRDPATIGRMSWP